MNRSELTKGDSDSILSQIKVMWKADSPFNPTNIGETIASVPNLHCKYLDILTALRGKMRKVETEYNKMKALKIKYYRGEMTRQELEDYGWFQWQGNKPLKTEIDDFLKGDTDVIGLVDDVAEVKVCIEYVESVMKSIGQRGYDSKTYLDYLKFSNGM